MDDINIAERLARLESKRESDKEAYALDRKALEEKIEQERKDCDKRYSELEAKVAPVIKTVQGAGWVFMTLIGVGTLLSMGFEKGVHVIKSIFGGHQ